MRSRVIPWLLLGPWLAGCVGINPEWDEPVAATAWMPGAQCDEADAGSDGKGGEDDDGQRHGERDDGTSGTDDGGDGDACGAAGTDACGDGLTACATEAGWFCADLREHDEHCGACFNDCAAHGDAVCHEGECFCRGGPWWQLCTEGCADTRTDPAGCGVLCVDCRVMYGPGARCETGICAPAWGG